jgi:hypothetical protein
MGAVLVVLGIFNAGLRWDIFGPRLQAVLYGVFASCMALAGFGVAMTFIIAVQESVKDFKKFVQSRTNQEETRDATRPAYLVRMAGVVLLMGLLVGFCALANHFVLSERCRVFKRLAREQVGNFEGKIAGTVQTFSAPPTNNVSPDLYDVLKTLRDLEFIGQATLYVPDPVETSLLWSFHARWEGYTNTYGFTRFYVAKDFERAIQNAFAGSAADLERLNSKNEFVWYAPLSGSDRNIRAVVRIDGPGLQPGRIEDMNTRTLSGEDDSIIMVVITARTH